MYEQSARWNEYYRELEPKRRRELLDRLRETEPDDGANAYRLRLFEARYTDERQPGREVDRFLFNCVSFIQLSKSARLFRRSAAREVERAARDMLLDEAARYGEAGERALYWELRNAAARYFSTCEGSDYNRTLFGLAASGDVSRRDRVCRDVWQMTEGLSARADAQGRLWLWNRAVTDAYAALDGGAQARLEAYRRKMNG